MQDESNQVSRGIDQQAHKTDLLAAVVSHVLVTRGCEGMAFEAISREVERDPANAEERQEVQLALQALVDYDLAVALGPDGWKPTRAAVRAADLSF